jgi:hypothetical protein
MMTDLPEDKLRELAEDFLIMNMMNTLQVLFDSRNNYPEDMIFMIITTYLQVSCAGELAFLRAFYWPERYQLTQDTNPSLDIQVITFQNNSHRFVIKGDRANV